MSETTVTDHPEENRYEAHDGPGGDLLGFAAYIHAQGDLIVFSHTEVFPANEGRGVGSALARAALDDVRSRGLKVMPLCPFIKAWMGRHPDYADLAWNAPRSTATD